MMDVREEQSGTMAERRLVPANERTLALGIAGVLLALEVVALSGLCGSAIAELWVTFGRWSPQGAPEVGRALAPMLIMYLVSAVHWRGPVFCLAVGLVFAAAAAIVGTAGGDPEIFFSNTLAVAAMAGIVHMLWQAKGAPLRRQVVVRRLLAPADTHHFLNSLGVPAEYFDSNDDKAFLEYNTPKGNALDGQKSYHANRNLLASHATAETASLRRQLSASCAQ